jgi:hypothetical protein
MHYILSVFSVRFKAGNGNLQAVVIDRNLGPSQRMHPVPYIARFNFEGQPQGHLLCSDSGMDETL